MRDDGSRSSRTRRAAARDKKDVRSMKSSLVTLALLGGSQAGVDGLDLKDGCENDGIHQKSLKRLP